MSGRAGVDGVDGEAAGFICGFCESVFVHLGIGLGQRMELSRLKRCEVGIGGRRSKIGDWRLEIGDWMRGLDGGLFGEEDFLDA